MRADRLLSILLLLQNGGKLSSRELAERLEVSERTIVRDMDALSAAGIPVYAERGSLGGWMLAENYRTSLTGMNRQEMLSLLMTQHSHVLGELGIPKRHHEAAYQKLLASSPVPVRQDAEMIRERLHIDGAGWHVSGESFPLLSVVQEAVWGQRKLEMCYRKSDSDTDYAAGTLPRRTVHPLGLVAKRNVWYLVAEENGELKTFRISRIAEAAVLEETFRRPPGFSLSGYWEQSTADFKSALPRYPATISITEQRLARLKRERYVKVLLAKPEDAHPGWLSVDVEFNTLESACEILLACGREAEALHPQELRELVRAEAAAIAALYR